MVTTVTKQLATTEDLVLGLGTVQQDRGGASVTLNKIDLAIGISSVLELAALDVTKYTRVKLYSGSNVFIWVFYDAGDVTGLQPDDVEATGTWHARSHDDIIFVPINGGLWQSGIEFTAINQYMIYNNEAYVPKADATFPLLTGTTPDLNLVQLMSKTPIHMELAKLSTFQGRIATDEYVVGTGVGDGVYEYSATDPTANLVNPQRADLAYLKLIVKDNVDAAQAGVVADGVTDFATNLQDANDYAKLNNVGLKVVNNAGGSAILSSLVNMTVSLVGVGRPLLKGIAGQTQLLKYNYPDDGIVIDSVVLDGNVSEDPLAWDSSNYDSFTGVYPLLFEGAKRFRIRDCKMQNSSRTGIWFQDCSNGEVSNTHSVRTRNEFGDGFYVNRCNNMAFNACSAVDHTRIGFVTENLSYDVNFNDCWANNGHDQSTAYGGTEFNRGFWFENSTDCNPTNCRATKQWDGGFTVTSGLLPDDRKQATYNLVGCIAKELGNPFGSGGFGFSLGNLDANATEINMEGCNAFECERPFESLTFSSGKSQHNYTGCHGESNGGIGVFKTIFFVEQRQPDSLVVNIKDCTGEFLAPIDRDPANKSGDIGTFEGLQPVVCNVDNYRNLVDVPIFKNTNSDNSVFYFKKTDGEYQLGRKSQIATFEDCTITDMVIGSTTTATTGHVHFKNCNLPSGSIIVTDSKLTGEVNVSGTAQIYHSLTDYPADGRPPFDMTVNIEADIAAQTLPQEAPIRIEYFDAGYGPAIVQGVWRNTGVPTGPVNKGFIVMRKAGQRTLANNLIVDDTVDFEIADDDGTIIPTNYAAGAQRVNLH